MKKKPNPTERVVILSIFAKLTLINIERKQVSIVIYLLNDRLFAMGTISGFNILNSHNRNSANKSGTPNIRWDKTNKIYVYQRTILNLLKI